jgi:hypothetical protein
LDFHTHAHTHTHTHTLTHTHTHRGIFLFNDIKDVKEWKKANDTRNSSSKKEDEEIEQYVAQRYIENAMLSMMM